MKCKKQARNSKIATEKVQELLNCKLLNSIDTNDGEAIKCSWWSTKQDFKIKDMEKMKLHFLSKYRYIREGETNSKYFLSWKSPDTLAKNIKSVMNSAAKLIHSQQEILSEQTAYYKAVYSKDSRV